MTSHRTTTRQNPASATPSASRTITLNSSQPIPGDAPFLRIPPSGTLHLRAEAGPSQTPAAESERRIHWAEDVVNNEGLGRKSSKICCIYHKPRAVGESSSEESSSDSSSDDNSDGGNDDGSARPSGRRAQPGNGHHKHDHDADDCACENSGNGRVTKMKGKGKKSAKNAYEHQPKNG